MKSQIYSNQAEACRQVSESQIFGHIAKASVIAQRPETDS